MTTPQSQTPVHVDYRNGTYYGQLSPDYKRNGKGMIILDTSTVLFAEWKDNQIEGMYVYLTDGIRAYGNMTNGKLDGYNIISTTSSYTGNGQAGQYSNMGQQSNNIRTFYGSFRNDKIYGRCVLVDNDSLMICQYNNNEIEQVSLRKSIRERQLFEILKEVFPNYLYTFDEYLTKFVKSSIAELEQLQEISRYQPCINYFSSEGDEKFFGFQEISKPNKKFGIMMRENQLISVGQHNNNLLQGIGRLYDKDHILDGAFRNGRVEGIGIDYTRTNNKFVLEIHDGVEDRVEKGFGFPLRQILEFRKEFHLRSIFFINDIAILNLKTKFQPLIGHIFMSPKRSVTQGRQKEDYRQQEKRFGGNSSKSASKRIQQSPLRQRLTKYEMESDIIEDNSPIRNRPNEYRPVDKNSNYFKEDNYQPRNNNYMRQDSGHSRNRFENKKGQEQRVSNSRRFNQTQQSNISQQQGNDRFTPDRSKNKFQQRQSRQRQTYNQILKQNAPYPNQNAPYPNQQPSQSRASRTHSNYNQQQQRQNPRDTSINRGRKDTRDLVKQLQNQQKERRLTLDQIYSKSNLYGRNKR